MSEQNVPNPEPTPPAVSTSSPDARPAPATVVAGSVASAEEVSAAAPPAARPPPSWRWPPLRGAGGVLLAAALLIGLLGWQWIELRQRVAQTQEQLARRLAEGATQLGEAKALAAGTQEAQQAQATRIAVLEARLAELHGQQGTLEGLYQELARGRDEWMLSEADQLVTLAAQQLQLGGNVPSAIAALTNADARLARSERPQWVQLRKAIGLDLQKLRALPLIDVPGISLRLENAALAVDQMTLAFEARPAAAGAKPKAVKEARESHELREPLPAADWNQWWQRWVGEVWQEVQHLIRIERLDRPDPAVLAPHNTVFLRENLKLRLLGARLALLGRDQATFKGELRLAVQWLERYFDTRDRQVASALESLKPLLATELSIELPTLADSQSALKAVKLAESRTAGQSAVRGAR